MEKLTTISYDETGWKDISEPFKYQFKETEELAGHIFHHVMVGLYVAEKEFVVTIGEMNQLNEDYLDIEFWVEMSEFTKPYEELDFMTPDELDEYMIKRGEYLEEDSNIYGTVCFARSTVYSRVSGDYIFAYMAKTSDSRVTEHVKRLLKRKLSREKKEMFPANYEACQKLGYPVSCSGKLAFEHPCLDDRKNGYPKHILINGCIGYMISPGIYHFGYPKILSDMFWDVDDKCPKVEDIEKLQIPDEGIAIIAEDMMIGTLGGFIPLVRYLAIGEKNFKVLQKIQNYIGEMYFEILKKGGKKVVSEPIIVDESAEELMHGIGIRNIKVGFRCVFRPRTKVEEYAYAYKTGDTLVLIDMCHGQTVRKEYDMRMLGELVVYREEVLNCGVAVGKSYYIIDCLEEREKQLLVPGAYELFQKTRNDDIDGDSEYN